MTGGDQRSFNSIGAPSDSMVEPQQMSGQPDTSDDLIAELARLMATNAKPEPASAPSPETAAKPAGASAPTPIRIPGSDVPPRTEAPLRIPGGDAPAPVAEKRPAAPVLRIPGMDVPAPANAGLTAQPEDQQPASAGAPPPHAQPFEPKVVSDRGQPQAPIHVVRSQPAAPPASPELDPIAAIIAAELDSAAAAPFTSEPRPAQGPVPAKFTAPTPRPANTSSAPRPISLSLAGQGRVTPTTPINLKPVHAPRVIPVESDSFGVAPAAAPMRPTIVADNDPMDEIESLIGEAVRVEMDRPAPVVTPVGGLAPRRTAPIEHKPDTTPRSADEAILAAAAATGAEVGLLNSRSASADEADTNINVNTDADAVIAPSGARRSVGNMRQYIGMAIAGTLLLAAGFGLYWVLGMGRGADGTVPVLTADASPVKVAPEPAITASTDAVPSSPVLNELDGVADNAGSETLVSTDQSNETDVAAVAEDETTDSGLANRKVRTVTVRPDGTIVAGEDTVAGSEALPDTRPNIPEVPGDATTATDVLATAAEGVAQDPIAAVIANPDAVPTTPATDLALVAPIATAATPVNIDPSIPVPLPPLANRPSAPLVDAGPAADPAVTPTPLATATPTNGQTPDLLAPEDVAATPAPTQTAAVTPPLQSSPGNPAPAYVQLSAQRDEATAMADARRFTERFSGVIGDTALEVHIVDLGAKGTWYRVLLPARSSAAANSACDSIKTAGGDCLIR